MKLGTLLSALLLLLLSIVGCATAPPATPTPEAATVRVVIAPFLSVAPLFIAQDEGYFAGQNIEVEVVELPRSADSLPLFLLGEIDVIAGFLNAGMLNAISAGETPKMVADKGYFAADGCTYMGLLQHKSAPVDSLANARIALRPNANHGYYVEKLLEEQGLQFSDIEVVDIPSPARIDAMADQSVDLVSAAEPWLYRTATEADAELLFGAQEVLPDAAFGFIFYSPDFASQQPDVATRFMFAYLQALRQYNEGKTDRNLAILADNTGIESDQLQEMCWPAMRADGFVDEQSVVAYQEWLLKRGQIDAVIEFDQLWDGRFVERANERLTQD